MAELPMKTAPAAIARRFDRMSPSTRALEPSSTVPRPTTSLDLAADLDVPTADVPVQAAVRREMVG